MHPQSPPSPQTRPSGLTRRTLFLIALGPALLAGGAVVTGCSGSGSNYQPSSNVTLGQELQDLQASYDKGIITKKEYENAKKRLMKKYTQ